MNFKIANNQVSDFKTAVKLKTNKQKSIKPATIRILESIHNFLINNAYHLKYNKI